MVDSIRIANELDALLYGTPDSNNPKARRLLFLQRPDGRIMTYSLMTGMTPTGVEEEIALEADGAQREQVILWDYTGAVQIRAAGEPATGQAQASLFGHDGTVLRRIATEDPGVVGAPGVLMMSNLGWNGAALTRFLLEAAGEQAISLHGEDPTNAIVGLRTDAQRIQRTRGFEPWRFADTQEPAPGGGYLTVYTVPAGALAVIEWRVTATAGAPLIDVHAVESGGAPDTSNAEVIGASPAPGALSMRDGPLELHAGGTIQCQNTAAAGNTGNVRVWVELYSTGDTP